MYRPKVGRPFGQRELEVLRMMSEGKAASQIAHELHVNVRTVHMFRNRIGHKAGCKTSLQLGVWAAKRGLV
jgi:DNA-binding NarL/FixJ family response regulator